MSDFTVEQLKKEIHKMDRNLSESDTAFGSALILLSATQVPNTVSSLVGFTGLSEEFVKERVTNLKLSGVFIGRKIACDWFEKDGGIAFWLDVNVAEGLLRREPPKHKSRRTKRAPDRLQRIRSAAVYK